MAEKAELLEPDAIGHRERVEDQAVECVCVAVGRLVARAVAPVIEHHDRVGSGEHVDVIRKVFLGSAETVHEHEPGTGPGNLDRELDTIVHLEAHCSMVTRIQPRAPPRIIGMPQGSEGKTRLGSGWKLAMRILVSLALLAFLATHVPNVNDLIPSQHRALRRSPCSPRPS